MSLLEWLKFWSKFRENTPILKYRIPPPPNENCQRAQIQEFQNTPPNENCQRVQIREFQNTPPMKIVRVQIQEFQNTPPMKIVRESKSESFRIPHPPQNENCRRVQIREFRNTPQPKNENCLRVQIREFENTPPMKIVRESKSESFRIPPPPILQNFRFQTSE